MKGRPVVAPKMPGDGKGSQEYDLYIQQQHGKREDSVYVRCR